MRCIIRIAYISLHWPRTRNGGVGKKIRSQIVAWNAMGHKVRLFMHTVQYESLSDLVEADYFVYLGAGKVKTELNRMHAVTRLLTAVREFQPDVIYLRYGIYVFPVHHLADIAPVVEEINTNDLTQHEGLGLIYSLYNRLTRGMILRRVHGLVTVSRELAVSPAFASYRKPTCVIANGVDLNAFVPLPAPSNQTPHIVFIGNPGYPWHGVDKLVTLARLIPDVQLDIIGYNELPGYQSLPGNITLHGYMSTPEYEKVLRRADAAISSLALHRVQLEEASPLKSRECLAFGLPLIVAYVDTDLDDLVCDFLLKIPNRENNLQTHAQAIRDFAYRMRGQRVQREQIIKLDQAGKEMERIKFFEQLLRGDHMSSGVKG